MCHQSHCDHHGCSLNPIFYSKKKKLEILKNCLKSLTEKEQDLREAIAEIEKQ
jgi:hypothetical protein